jgi:hypothetical protein
VLRRAVPSLTPGSDIIMGTATAVREIMQFWKGALQTGSILPAARLRAIAPPALEHVQ